MGNGRSLQDYRKLARRYAQLRKALFLAQDLVSPNASISDLSRSRLVRLNGRRLGIQHDLARVHARLSKVCVDCAASGGSCCWGDFDHFTATDYWLRRYSDSPLDACGAEFPEVMSNARVLWDRVGRIIRTPSIFVGGGGCSFLEVGGCTLENSDKPIKCIAMTCVKLREIMTQEQKEQFVRSLDGLYTISLEVLDVLGAESGASAWRRWRAQLSLAFTF